MSQVHAHYLVRSLMLFIAGFCALQYGWELCRGTAIERLVIDQSTVLPAAGLIRLVWPGQQVFVQDHSLISVHNRLNILNGCEGLETWFLLVAALVAYPLHRRVRALGLILSAILIYALNQLRIVLLWWALRTDPTLFGLLHGTVFPLVLIAIAAIFFWAFVPYRRTDAQ